MPQFPAGQTLLIDADDTLWENNIYFERAIAAFIGFLDHQEYTPAQVRLALNTVERETILSHGYGLTSFTRSLVTCFERLSPAPMTAAMRDRVEGFARAIQEQEIELSRSGLAPFFAAVEIVAEKDPPTYREVIQRQEVTAHSAWMIGNSIKSDINPALAAGLHAVFLFHKDTWVLEHAELDAAPEGQKLLELDAFAKLAEIF